MANSVKRQAPWVLVVDDDLEARSALESYLSELGCKSASAASEQEALDILASRRFQLVITELALPELNGAAQGGAKLDGAALEDADLSTAGQDGAELDGADQEGADLNTADQDGAALDGADLNAAEQDGAALDGADLHALNLKDADLNAAAQDGVEFIAKLKRDAPEMEVLVLSSLEGVELEIEAARQRACEFLSKPFKRHLLGSTLVRCLALRPLAQAGRELSSLFRLLELSRRVAAASQSREMAEALLSAALVETGARAGLCLAPNKGELSVVRAAGLLPEHFSVFQEPASLKAFEEAFAGEAQEPYWAGGAGRQLPFVAEIAQNYGGNHRFLPFPGAREDVSPQGALVLLGGSELVQASEDPGREAALELLCRSASVAVNNQRRFDDSAHLAYRDDLTRLYNSRYLRLSVERELAREDQAPFALIFLDLDKFKEINDSRGHLEGSQVLVELGQVLRSCIRDTDICTRYGGDEFCVILPDTGELAALRVAERIRSGIARHIFAKELSAPVRLTASLGVALFPEHGRSWEELLASADRAMYAGKRGSQDVVVLAEAGGL